MNQHILAVFGEKIEKYNDSPSYYDFETQRSYRDKTFLRGISADIRQRGQSTILTETTESSDGDHVVMTAGVTMETRTVETSDNDHIYLKSTTVTTFTTEDSDKDY